MTGRGIARGRKSEDRGERHLNEVNANKNAVEGEEDVHRELAEELEPGSGETPTVENAEPEIPESQPPESQPPESQPDDEAARLREEIDELRDLLRRKQAEFENYRKRVERERQDFIEHATAELVAEVLPVLDNLERALETPESSGEDRFREGIEITYRQFRDILSKAGLREIEARGREFDPHVHEAVGRIETDKHTEGKVLEVYQKGYFYKGRLLRPALVGVVQRPAETNDADAEATNGSSEDEEHGKLQSDVTQS